MNYVGPGQVHSKMAEEKQQSQAREQGTALEALRPLGFRTPADAAYAVALLLADTGQWISGTSLVVDRGYSPQ